jgi:hypothetical protein
MNESLRFPFTILLIAVVYSAVPNVSGKETSRVPAGDAEELVRAALKGQGAGALDLLGLRIELMQEPIDTTFYYFEVTWSNPSPASVVVGHYAVDPMTGDVWDGIVCSEMVSPPVRALQRRIRHRLGMSDSRYQRLKRPGPMC